MTIDDIFREFGGPTKLGEVLGVPRNHAGLMRARGSIPSEYWPRLVDGAKAKGIEGVTYEALAKIAESRRATAPSPTEATAE